MANIKIGAFRFEVRDVPKLADDDDRLVDGYLDHSRTEILLDADLSNDARLATLVHEIVHEKVEIQCGHNLRDEGLIDAIAFSWIEVMRDNPELVRMITKG
jgi:hypothetical protein